MTTNSYGAAIGWPSTRSAPGLAGDGGAMTADPDVVDLHRLRAGAAQLLDGVEQRRRPATSLGRVADGHRQARPLGGTVPLRMPSASARSRASSSAAADSLSELPSCCQRRALVGDLLPQPVLLGVEVVEDADQVLLARAGELLVGRRCCAPGRRRRSRAAASARR